MGRAMAHGEATAALRFATNALWLVGVGLGVLMVALRVELARLGGDPLQAWVFIAVALVTVIVCRGPSGGSWSLGGRVSWSAGDFLATPIGVNIVFLRLHGARMGVPDGASEAAFVA